MLAVVAGVVQANPPHTIAQLRVDADVVDLVEQRDLCQQVVRCIAFGDARFGLDRCSVSAIEPRFEGHALSDRCTSEVCFSTFALVHAAVVPISDKFGAHGSRRSTYTECVPAMLELPARTGRGTSSQTCTEPGSETWTATQGGR